ncbi:MAG: MoxR family ATPase [Pseudomonadota bacterium]
MTETGLQTKKPKEQVAEIGKHKLANLQRSLESKIIGQKSLIENLLVCLLCDGHMLIEGMPGLAKTTAAKSIAAGIAADFHRIQFTPDLLPSDLIGTEIYVHEKSNFTFRKGPIFNNIVLADEINRAPAKVQSALLESMEERQVTVGHQSYQLPELYMVLATQNPIEQEGTYNLPEAQLDRFAMYVVVDYPSHAEELLIADMDMAKQVKHKSEDLPVTSTAEIGAARESVAAMYMDEKVKDYIVSLVIASRNSEKYAAKLGKWIAHGASPRATLTLIRCTKALAWLRGDEYVTPHHVQEIALPILRHRIIPTFAAEAEGVTREMIVKRLLEVVAIP